MRFIPAGLCLFAVKRLYQGNCADILTGNRQSIGLLLDDLFGQRMNLPANQFGHDINQRHKGDDKHGDQWFNQIHHDHTSRVQTVRKTDNPGFYELLKVWKKKTGCPMLLNTSLNIKGQPIVNDHLDGKAFEQKYGVKVF